MNPFSWNDKHAVGMPEIDDDHRALFHIAEQLYDAIEHGATGDKLDGLLARLASYAKFHFESEESLMRRTRFPGYAQHCREHERFTARISYLKTLGPARSEDAAKLLLDFLRVWMEEHMCGEDHRMASHVRQVEG
jgi:hemerythrin-like metal-binding protein